MKEIKKDLFNIVKRLKKIDKNYFVIFNRLKNRFEVHCKSQKNNTLAFCCEGKLDYSVLLKAHKTSIKNAKRILNDITKSNEELNEKKERLLKEKHIDMFNSFLNYAQSKSIEINFDGVDKTRWV